MMSNSIAVDDAFALASPSGDGEIIRILFCATRRVR